GSQLVSLGTFEKVEGDVRIQVNLGWMVDQNNLRLLLQAKDSEDNAIADVEVRVTESDKGLIYSSKTNQDGAVVAPAVKINPGQYQIQVFWSDKVVETPFFRV
ncbi:MAG TPA: carboxypeptidase-like regulatory domain-containing protein, partial [Candidatus Obscuribacter sp.]|nr:carboxypeptidase-like regulatory domain-containing protein [Candidatus Obscuribacter sp.]